MNLIIVMVLLIIQIPNFIAAQNVDGFEIQVDKIDSNSNFEIQIFYEKFNSWTESIGNDSVKLELNKERMVNNFIIFSEDGLIMKDLDFHSVESCKENIFINLPKQEINKQENNWIFISMESHVNKNELIEILKFLRQLKIQYIFGIEDEFAPKIIKDKY